MDILRWDSCVNTALINKHHMFYRPRVYLRGSIRAVLYSNTLVVTDGQYRRQSA